MGMIECGGDINAKDKDGITALMFAAARGQTDCVRVLLAIGADINARDRFDRTALKAAELGQKMMLLQY